MQEKFDVISEDSIIRLMDIFYNKVRFDLISVG